MREDLTEIVCVMDKSGSMLSVMGDSVGSFNQFIDDQRNEYGEALLTLTLFDTTYKSPIFRQDIQEVKKLRTYRDSLGIVQEIDERDYIPYNPGGMTALLDAVGKTIDEVGNRLDETPEHEKPGKVIFVVLTDGQENSSIEYTFDIVKHKIEHQKGKYNWEFLFLGAGENTIKQASKIGISLDKTLRFNHTSDGHKVATRSCSNAVSSFRNSGDIGDWKRTEDF